MKYLYSTEEADGTYKIEVSHKGASFYCYLDKYDNFIRIYPTPKYPYDIMSIYNLAIKNKNRTIIDECEDLIKKIKGIEL